MQSGQEFRAQRGRGFHRGAQGMTSRSRRMYSGSVESTLIDDVLILNESALLGGGRGLQQPGDMEYHQGVGQGGPPRFSASEEAYPRSLERYSLPEHLMLAPPTDPDFSSLGSGYMITPVNPGPLLLTTPGYGILQPMGPMWMPQRAPVGPMWMPQRAPVGPMWMPQQAPVGPTWMPQQAPVGPMWMPQQAPLDQQAPMWFPSELAFGDFPSSVMGPPLSLWSQQPGSMITFQQGLNPLDFVQMEEDMGTDDDRHQDMRLNIDYMSYEDLSALEEQMGTVSTGLAENVVQESMKQKKYKSTPSCKADSCCICLEDYAEGEDLGVLACGHYFHVSCIGKWLVQQNFCPLCKKTALSP